MADSLCRGNMCELATTGILSMITQRFVQLRPCLSPRLHIMLES